MMEEADILLNKRNAKLLRSLEDSAVILAASGSCDVLDAGSRCAEDVVDEGELVLVRRFSLKAGTNFTHESIA